ncbi:MAG: cation transporter [Gammaproteobacteria bacterium]|nr:cation transporter [Gammaproteobacteria bacterium]
MADDHDTHHTMLDTSDPVRYRASRRVTLVSLAVNTLLAAGQVTIGILGHSQALVADGIHTLSDITTDLLVLFAIKHGAKAADAEHPYGHGRIETAITVVLGVALIVVAGGIAINAGMRLRQPGSLPLPDILTLWAAAITIVAKEGLYRYTVRAADRYKSNLLRANAWHHRSDAISSVIVFAGIAGSLAGYPYLDALAALGVAMMIAQIGWHLGWSAIKELIDTALSEEEVAKIRNTILDIQGVKALHMLRTRRTGGHALVDVHILVDNKISVSEGHHISETVRLRICEVLDSVSDVMVHIDPEDDELASPTLGLPLRQEFLGGLNRKLIGIQEATQIKKASLHYLNGQIHVVLYLPVDIVQGETQRALLLKRFRDAVEDDPQIGSLDLCYQ